MDGCAAHATGICCLLSLRLLQASLAASKQCRSHALDNQTAAVGAPSLLAPYLINSAVPRAAALQGPHTRRPRWCIFAQRGTPALAPAAGRGLRAKPGYPVQRRRALRRPVQATGACKTDGEHPWL